MLLTKLLRSATFRLTLAYLAVFCLSALALFAFVYEASITFMEQQTRETVEAEIQGLREQYALGGLAALERVIRQRAEAERSRSSIYLLVDRWGGRVAGNLDHWPEGKTDESGLLRFRFERIDDKGHPELRHALGKRFVVAGRWRLLVGRDVEDRIATQKLLLNAMTLGGGLMIVVGLIGGFTLSRWTLSRLEGINRATKLIMAGELSRRIRVEGSEDEFDELAHNLNAMLDRIEALISAMQQVTDNIAHDLRTPLTRLRSRIEVALLGRLGAEEARRLLEDTVREIEGMIATFNALLAIARAESGSLRSEWEDVDLREIALEVFDLYEPLAEERRIELLLEAPSSVRVRGQPQLLAQALANLVDNAIKYSDPGSDVVIRVLENPCPTLEVADHGPGIPEGDRRRVLERFVRLQLDRSTPGNGLGLSLVDAVARLHRASLELADNHPGLRISLRFEPLSDAGMAAEPARTALPSA